MEVDGMENEGGSVQAEGVCVCVFVLLVKEGFWSVFLTVWLLLLLFSLCKSIHMVKGSSQH